MPSASLLQFQLGGSDFPAAVRAVGEGTVDGVEARLIGRQGALSNASMHSAVQCGMLAWPLASGVVGGSAVGGRG